MRGYRALLLFTSLALIEWATGKVLWFLLFAFFPYAMAYFLGAPFWLRKRTLACLNLIILAPLLYFKIVSAQNLSQEVFVFLGLSFLVFRQVSFFVDLFRAKEVKLPSPLDYGLFLFFFPSFLAGPIQRFKSFTVQSPKWNRETFWSALEAILLGLTLKLVVADTLRSSVDRYFSHRDETGVGALGVFAFLFALQFFCDFSAYTHLARGVALLLGWQLPENFQRPYLAANLQDFWQRWHRSLSEWFRDYLYLPLFFSTKRIMFSLFFTFFAMGVWHGLSLNFVFLGAYLGVMMVLYAWVQGPWRKWQINTRAPWTLFLSGRIALWLCVVFAFVLLRDRELNLFYKPIVNLGLGIHGWHGFQQLLWGLTFVVIAEWLREQKEWKWRLLLISWIINFSFLVFFFSEVRAERDLRFLYFQF
jgi:D-alanyl-lipoteichoic acid acyltransferase DltB (MBOAT superfamily)